MYFSYFNVLFVADKDLQSRDEKRTALHFAASYVPLIQDEQCYEDDSKTDKLNEDDRQNDRRCSGVKAVRVLINKGVKVSQGNSELVTG